MARSTLILLALLGCAPPPAEPWLHAGAAMGTTYAVQAPRLPPGLDGRALAAEVDALILGLDARLSTWRPDSELSRFGASRSTGWFAVAPDTARLVDEALRLAERSGGAFDPTVAPLVALWGFGAGADGRAEREPTEQELAGARARVGHELAEARLAPPALRKLRPDAALDLSGIAKGRALDAVGDHLEARGVTDYLVELGGELRARGRSAAGRAWRVAIEAPAPGALRTRAQRVIALADAAVATSGDARQSLRRGDRRDPHVIDPRTARPAANGVAAVSVVATSATLADGLATALMVLGPDEGLRLAAREGAAALFLLHTEAGLVERASPGFPLLGVAP